MWEKEIMEWRYFRKTDWDSYAGAEKPTSWEEPIIATCDFVDIIADKNGIMASMCYDSSPCVLCSRISMPFKTAKFIIEALPEVEITQDVLEEIGFPKFMES